MEQYVLISSLLNESSNAERLNELKRDCSDWLQLNFAMYRGTKRRAEPFTTFIPRTDRTPLDSAPASVGLFNWAVSEQYGERNIRNRSIFGTPDRNFAKTYGIQHVIFPVNGYKLFQYTAGKDSNVIMSRINEFYEEHEMYFDESDLSIASPRDLNHIRTINKTDQAWVDYLIQSGENKDIAVEEFKWVEHEVRTTIKQITSPDLIRDDGELMLLCDKYYVIPFDSIDFLFPDYKKVNL